MSSATKSFAPEAANENAMKPLVVIPSRLGSSRLPNKPLADINGKPMIVHVWERAVKAGAGPVVVAAAEKEIADVIEQAGGQAVLTDPAHPSGSDRIWEAVQKFDPQGLHDVIINVQGDLPNLDPAVVRDVLKPLADSSVDIGTLVVPIEDQAERDDPNVVKAIAAFKDGEETATALDFVRDLSPEFAGAASHHMGIYAYRRETLGQFVSLSPSEREQERSLEQMRAMDNGMKIGVAQVETAPLSVDTPADLEFVRQEMAAETAGKAKPAFA